MSRRNPKETEYVETAAKVAIGAAAAYGCYKLYQSVVDSNPSSPPHQVNVEQSSVNRSRSHDSLPPPSPTLGAKVSNVIDGMHLALRDAMPRDEFNQRNQSTPLQPLQSTHPAAYPHPIQPDRPGFPALDDGSHRNKSTTENLLETVQAAYSGFKLYHSVLGGSDSSNHRQLTYRAVVVETDQQSQEALKQIKEWVFFDVFHLFFPIKFSTSKLYFGLLLFGIDRHCQGYKVLGLECECVERNNTRLPVSLIQLATQRGYCALFRLNKLNRMPPMLKVHEECEREEIVSVPSIYLNPFIFAHAGNSHRSKYHKSKQCASCRCTAFT